MRITHAITRGDVGGAQTHVVELATAQHHNGDVVEIIAGCDGPALARAREAGVTTTVLPELVEARSGQSLRPAYRALSQILSQSETDVVHAHSSHAGLLARVAARRNGLASVYTAHGWPFQAGAAFAQRLQSVAGEVVGGRLGDAVICLTEREAQVARRAFVASRDRIWVIPNGIADVAARRVAFSQEQSGGRGEPIVLVMVARFAPPKLQADLIERLAPIKDLPWELRLIGDGPELARAEEVAEKTGGRVTFLGHRDDVADQLAAADIAILWSRYEGMPISVLEAMRAGLCCVASDLPGVRTLFGNPPSGVVVSEPARLPADMRALLANPERIDALGASARDRYLAEFTAETMMRRTRAVYESVIGRRRKAGDGSSAR